MNLYENLEYIAGGERIDLLLQDKNLRIERITSSKAPSGPYNQFQDEWVLVLEGWAILEISGKKVKLTKGDNYFIRSFTEHSVLETSEKCLWLCVFVTTREDGMVNTG